MKKVFLSRSRIEASQSCEVRGYFEYSWGGIGIKKNPGPVYFDTGSAIHEGLAACLNKIKAGVTKPTRQNVSDVISATLKAFDSRSKTLDMSALSEHVAKLELEYRDEQRDLSAAIVYAWCVEEWQPFAERFEVLAVELDSHFVNVCNGVELNWESKADAIVCERLSPHQISVFSWKSARDTKEWTRRRHRSDLQGFLECYFAQAHTGLCVDFNQVVYLVKGKKLRVGDNGIELPWNAPIEEVKRYQTDSFLLYPAVKPPETAEPFFNEIQGVVPDVVWSPSYRRYGNTTDSQYRGWTRADRFKLADLDASGWPVLFNWIDSLKNNTIFPTAEFNPAEPPLNRVIVWERPSARNDELTAQLLEEISLAQSGLVSPGRVFSRNLKSCYDGPPDANGKTGCPFVDLCRGPGMQRAGLAAPGMVELPTGFIWRKPHHERELEYVKQQMEVPNGRLL